MSLPVRMLVVVLSMAGCASADPEVRSAAAADRVVVEEVALLPAAGFYHVAEVEDFGRPDAGSMARYAPVDSLASRLPRLDVFVYPAGHAVDVEAAIARRGMMEYDRRSPNVNRTVFENERWFPLANGDSAFAATLSMEVGGRPSRSLLYLYRVGDRFLKVRTTFPLPVGVGPDRIIDVTVEAIYDNATTATRGGAGS